MSGSRVLGGILALISGVLVLLMALNILMDAHLFSPTG